MRTDRRGFLGVLAGMGLLGVTRPDDVAAEPSSPMPLAVEPYNPDALPELPHGYRVTVDGQMLRVIECDMLDEIGPVRRSVLRCLCYGFPALANPEHTYAIRVSSGDRTYYMRARLARYTRALRADRFVEMDCEWVGDGWAVTA